VPPNLVAHVRLATVRDGCLVLQADGSTWAAQLRFKAPQILEQLRRLPDFSQVQSVRVRNAARAEPLERRPPRAVMSQAGGDALRSQAACTEDGPLRAALERLARNAGSR
jgi:hypothetical protein